MITNPLPSAALLLQQVAVNDEKRNKKRSRNQDDCNHSTATNKLFKYKYTTDQWASFSD